jgi:two-component system NarL family sensor kinase
MSSNTVAGTAGTRGQPVEANKEPHLRWLASSHAPGDVGDGLHSRAARKDTSEPPERARAHADPRPTGARRVRPVASVSSAVTKFTLSGLAALILVGIGGSLVLRRIGISEAIDEARQLTRVIGKGVVEPHLTDGVVGGNRKALARLDRVVRDRILRDPVARVKIWSPDGRIVYSDEPRLIGSSYPGDERPALSSGEVQAELSDLSGPENRFERPRAGRLLEVYLPVRTTSGKPLLFEAYMRFSSVAASGQRIWLAFGPALLAALVLLEITQVPLAWSMARRLNEGQKEQEDLLQRAIEASDAERRRIARDLHDGVVQDLAGVSFSLAATADRLEGTGGLESAGALRQAAARSRQIIRQLRTLVVDIYPPNLHTAGLEEALSDLVAPLVGRGIAVRVDVAADPRPSPTVEALVFRTAQESVRNALTHSHARSVDVRIGADDRRVWLVVEDDGQGFGTEELERRQAEGHVGLRLLGNLVADAGGMLEVRSTAGTGTQVRLELPR